MEPLAKSLREVYEEIQQDNTKIFYQDKDGQGFLPFKTCLPGRISNPPKISIYSGSFNPLHFGHMAIYKKMMGKRRLTHDRYFEMSIHRRDKPPVSLEDLELRLKQFVGVGPVMVSNLMKFVEKAGALRDFRVTFHVGADTMTRIMADHSLPEIQGMNCKFVYYDRMQDGELIRLPDRMPVNSRKGGKLSIAEMQISSTSIRNSRI